MKRVELKIARIGNSRGVRLPATTLERYGFGDTAIMEERSDGILLRPIGPANAKLSWEETVREMAAFDESWDEWDAAAADGEQSIPWNEESRKRVAEKPAADYRTKRRRKK